VRHFDLHRFGGKPGGPSAVWSRLLGDLLGCSRRLSIASASARATRFVRTMIQLLRKTTARCTAQLAMGAYPSRKQAVGLESCSSTEPCWWIPSERGGAASFNEGTLPSLVGVHPDREGCHQTNLWLASGTLQIGDLFRDRRARHLKFETRRHSSELDSAFWLSFFEFRTQSTQSRGPERIGLRRAIFRRLRAGPVNRSALKTCDSARRSVWRSARLVWELAEGVRPDTNGPSQVFARLLWFPEGMREAERKAA
jgi:hypothetical protein